MIAKAIKGSIKNTYLRKLRLHCREYEWKLCWGDHIYDRITMIYLIFKIIKPDTSIVVSKIKYEIEK